MTSITDEQQVATAEGDSASSLLYMSDEYLKGAMPLTMAAVHGETSSAARAASPAVRAAPPTEQYRPSPSPWSAPGSGQAPVPAAASGGAVDGKQFFRNARNSLSYEMFNKFLANIKRLNNQQQTREETLEEARRIFGPELSHLYQDFETLLNRGLTA
eukprot:gnl/TRDRNA2_/TRDRNA2_83164_c0_seq1.p1 gnl/TRDRNA2_/TRDRNA2_83164_c0~~gnl/TRDRNA2_/TRDRNA2_83164_c0_seq1.p1  ORF type:complete len:158 (-),score=38.34 gnl/TRDRNA2_/TRDRNA2_83164_c0_seq1:305-778(-)